MSAVFNEIERRIAALPKAEQGPRRALLDRAADAITEKPLAELGPLVDKLTGTDDDVDAAHDWSLAAARTRNLERIFADQARLISESISGATIRAGMGVSRQRLHQMVSQNRLVAIQLQAGGSFRYPFWQFSSSLPVQPIDGLPRLIEAAREAGLEPLTLHFFMVEPNDRLGGRAPHEFIAAGELDRVIDVLLSAGLGSF